MPKPSYPSIKNPYQHAGTSQVERLLHALMPAYFKLDDRSIKDILAATHRYAEFLHFYKDNNQVDGNWTCFWEVETLTFLAMLSAIDADAVGEDFAVLEKQAKEGGQSSALGYQAAMVYLLQQVQKINDFHQKMPDGLAFKREIYHLIKKDDDTDADQLASALATLISYHKEAYQEANPELENLPHELYEMFLYSDLWGIPSVEAFYDISSSPDYRLDDWENLRQLAKTFQQAMQRIKHRSAHWFDQNLATPQLRQPHVALYLAFLRLFEYARQEMNNLTQRHLEFFYTQILHLRPQPAQPDGVHLLFQLANNVDQYLVEQGTTLLAGKLRGKNLRFQTLEDWVFNKAQVVEIKNTYLDLHKKLAGQAHIYASPDVKKVYQAHVELPNEKSNSWRSMGDDGNLPFGEIGFAIASPQLILREGRRKINIAITLAKSIGLKRQSGLLTQKLSTENFKLYLSTEEGWIEPAPNSNPGKFGFQLTSTEADDKIEFTIYLEQDTPPVVRFSADLQKEIGFYTSWPIFKCSFNHEFVAKDTTVIPYLELFNKIRCITISNITIGVEVEDIRENLIIQSDLGVFDGLQKFFPFGPNPELKAHFYVGSTEIFQKALNTLKVCFDWIDPPAHFSNHYANYVGTTAVTGTGGGFELDFTKKLFDVNNPPKLQIGFIDKAKLEFPELVSRSGRLVIILSSGLGTLVGTVTDIGDNLLAGVEVKMLGSSNPGVMTGADGRYLLPGVIGTSKITLSKKNSTGQRLAAREFLPGSNYESEAISINNAGQIDCILVPAIQNRPDIATDAAITNRPGVTIKDIFGKLIVSAVITATSGTGATTKTITASFNSGRYAFNKAEWQGLGKPATLKFSSVGYKSRELPNLHDYFDIDVVLEPEEVQKKATEGSDPLNGKVSGRDDKPIVGVKITGDLKANPATKVVVYSASDGIYSFPANVEFAKITFEYPDYEVFEFKDFSDSFNVLDIKLSEPKQVIKFKGEVNGSVNTPANGLNIKIVGKNIAATSTSYTLKGTTSDKVLESDVIEITPGSPSPLPPAGVLEYHPVRFSIDGNSKIDSTLKEKITRVANNAPTGEIHIQIESFGLATGEQFSFASGGANINPEKAGDVYKFVNGAASGQPQNASTIANNGLSISFSDNILTISKDQLSLKDNIKVVFYKNIQLKTGTPNGDRSIKGIVRSGTSLLPNVRIIARSSTYSISTQTDANGAYNFPFIPAGSLELEFLHPSSSYVYTSNDLDFNQLDINLFPVDSAQVLRSQKFNNAIRLLVKNTKSDASLSLGDFTYILNDTPVSSLPTRINPNDRIRLFSSKDASIAPLAFTVDGYPEIELVMPLEPVLRNIKGKIQDIDGAHQIKVPIVVDGKLLKAESDASGDYELKIPINSEFTNPKLNIQQEGFFPVQVTVEDAAYDTYSYIDFNLNFKQFNRFPLIKPDNTIASCFPTKVNGLNLVRDIRTQDFTRYSPTLKRGFIRLTLEEKDFLHDEYPNILVASTILAAKPESTRFQLPNSPYSPSTNGIKVNYTSVQQIFPIPEEEQSDPIDEFFQILPFNGYRAENLLQAEVKIIYPYTIHDLQTGNPDFCKDNFAPANLYLGLKDLRPGTNLSLLFQVKAGTEASFEDLPPDELHWSYLAANNQWKPFTVDRMLKDTTRRLTRTGIVQLKLPFDLVKENTLLNRELHWIRIAAQEDADAKPPKTARALPNLVNVQAQVIEAQFVLDAEDPEHYLAEKPLPAGSIKRLEISDSNVKKIEQPFSSYNGSIPEAGAIFYHRVSERLRHRDRAVTAWDYERIILEQFPQVYRAKALRHTDLNSELAPGHVLIALIPDLQQWDLENPLKPRFSRGDLDEMADFLRHKTNLFVALKANAVGPYLHVENPCYEEVSLDLTVKFKAKLDEEYAILQLKAALTGFIAPWVSDPAQDISFDRALDRSRLVQFIEMQSYVDAILDLTITHEDEPTNDKPLIIPFTSRSVLTSGEHTINLPKP